MAVSLQRGGGWSGGLGPASSVPVVLQDGGGWSGCVGILRAAFTVSSAVVLQRGGGWYRGVDVRVAFTVSSVPVLLQRGSGGVGIRVAFMVSSRALVLLQGASGGVGIRAAFLRKPRTLSSVPVVLQRGGSGDVGLDLPAMMAAAALNVGDLDLPARAADKNSEKFAFSSSLVAGSVLLLGDDDRFLLAALKSSKLWGTWLK